MLHRASKRIQHKGYESPVVARLLTRITVRIVATARP